MTELAHIDINPRVLVWARESIAMSRNQAIEKTGINTNRLVQLESGKKQPTVEELKSISKTYKRTMATLLLREPPEEKPLPADRRTIDSKDLGSFDEKTILMVRKARALAQSFKELREEMGQPFPKFSLSASMQERPQDVAAQVRQLLQLDTIRSIININYALEAYIEKVESLGVAVFQLSLTRDNLRGFAIVDDIVPIIGIKRGGEQAHSKTFTLFHELGHVLLNEGGLCDLSPNTPFEIEKWCNGFSAELLIPSAELLQMEIVVKQQHQNQKIWAKKDLIDLGAHFHVGPLAILRSLLEHRLTTRAFYQEHHEKWNKPSFGRSKHPQGRNIAKETIREKGRAYINLAFQAFDQNRISIKDLSDFLGVKLSYIPKTRELLNT